MGNSLDLILRILGDSSGAKKAVAEASGATSALGKANKSQFANMSAGAAAAGSTLTRKLTIPLVGLAAISSKMAMDAESQWAEIRKVYGGAASDIETKLSPAVDALSKRLGIQKTATREALAEVAAMGYTGEAAIDKLNQSMEFSVLGNMELERSMAGVIATSKIYNIEGAALRRTLALMNTVENTSSASMEDLAEAITIAAEVGKAAGVDIAELSGHMAVLRERAIPAGEAANALKTIYTRIQNPTKKAKEVLDKYNISIRDSEGHILQADKAIEKIAKSWPKMTDAQREDLATGLVGIYQKGKFLSLVEDLQRKNSTYKDVLDKTSNATKNLNGYEKELNIALDQSKVKYERIKVRLAEVAEKIGADVLPVMLDLGEGIANITDKFSKLDPKTQASILKLAGIAVVLGPTLRVLGATGGALGTIYKMLVLLGGGKAAKGLGALGAAGAGGIAGGGGKGAKGKVSVPAVPSIIPAAKGLGYVALIAGTINAIAHIKDLSKTHNEFADALRRDNSEWDTMLQVIPTDIQNIVSALTFGLVPESKKPAKAIAEAKKEWSGWKPHKIEAVFGHEQVTEGTMIWDAWDPKFYVAPFGGSQIVHAKESWDTWPPAKQTGPFTAPGVHKDTSKWDEWPPRSHSAKFTAPGVHKTTNFWDWWKPESKTATFKVKKITEFSTGSDHAPKNMPSKGGAGSVYGGNGKDRALGGSVRAGEIYRIREKGDELFMPGRSGTIVPNHKIPSAMGSDKAIAALQAELRAQSVLLRKIAINSGLTGDVIVNVTESQVETHQTGTRDRNLRLRVK